MVQTAMQELIDRLKSKGGGMEIYLNANTEIINESLEKQKEQIENAMRVSYKKGWEDAFEFIKEIKTK
jgi:hypothetical protein